PLDYVSHLRYHNGAASETGGIFRRYTHDGTTTATGTCTEGTRSRASEPPKGNRSDPAGTGRRANTTRHTISSTPADNQRQAPQPGTPQKDLGRDKTPERQKAERSRTGRHRSTPASQA